MVLKTIRSGMLSTVSEVSESPDGHVVFGPTCYSHAVANSHLFQSIRIQGISSEEQLEEFVLGEEGVKGRQQLISECDGINCEESCPKTPLSIEATVCIANQMDQNISASSNPEYDWETVLRSCELCIRLLRKLVSWYK